MHTPPATEQAPATATAGAPPASKPKRNKPPASLLAHVLSSKNSSGSAMSPLSAGSPDASTAHQGQQKQRPDLKLNSLDINTSGFMSTGLDGEEELDPFPTSNASDEKSIFAAVSESSYASDDDGTGDAFKISQSGTFEFGAIMKIGYDGIRKYRRRTRSQDTSAQSTGSTGSTDVSLDGLCLHDTLNGDHSSSSAQHSGIGGDGGSSSGSEPTSASSPHVLSVTSPPTPGVASSASAAANGVVTEEMISSRGEIKFEDLIVKGKLGSGASASVKKVVHRITGKEFAQKIIEIGEGNDMKPRAILAEYSALFDNDCEYIIELIESFYRDGHIYMILEYMNCGSLRDLIKTTGPIPEAALAKIAFQILKGLEYIHDRLVIHRDLKPENILANHNGQIKIADFGMAGFRKDSVPFETFQGTFTYMSPERLLAEKHSFSSDIWSFGLTILECAVGRFPFDLKDIDIWNMVEVVQNIQEKIVLPPNASPEFKRLVLDCLKFDASERPSAHDLLQYEFITQNQNNKPSLRRWINDEYISKKKKEKAERERLRQETRQAHGGVTLTVPSASAAPQHHHA